MFVQEQITSVKDALEEVELLVEDTCRLRVGEVFMVLSQDEVTAALEAKTSALEKKLESSQAELEAITKNLAVYKRELYGKFGTDNINLED